MFKLLVLATLASATITNGPTIQFTNDSVYAKNNIITCEVLEITNQKVIPSEEEGVEDTIIEEVSKTLSLKENHLLGYTIYDNPETSYIDGLKFDDNWVTDWVIENYDDSVEHVLKIKTVYTDDVSGMLMAAKNGDWSRVLSNPLILFQLFYYILAAVSIILGLFGVTKSKSKRIKTVDEYATALDLKCGELFNNFTINTENAVENYVDKLISPVYEKMQAQQKDLISALILSQSGDKDSKLALINLLQTSAKEDVALMANQMKKSIQDAHEVKQALKTNAETVIKEIAEDTFKEPKDPIDNGTSI